MIRRVHTNTLIRINFLGQPSVRSGAWLLGNETMDFRIKHSLLWSSGAKTFLGGDLPSKHDKFMFIAQQGGTCWWCSALPCQESLALLWKTWFSCSRNTPKQTAKVWFSSEGAKQKGESQSSLTSIREFHQLIKAGERKMRVRPTGTQKLKPGGPLRMQHIQEFKNKAPKKIRAWEMHCFIPAEGQDMEPDPNLQLKQFFILWKSPQNGSGIA